MILQTDITVLMCMLILCSGWDFVDHRTQLTTLVGRLSGIRTQSGQTNWEECGPCPVFPVGLVKTLSALAPPPSFHFEHVMPYRRNLRYPDRLIQLDGLVQRCEWEPRGPRRLFEHRQFLLPHQNAGQYFFKGFGELRMLVEFGKQC